MCIILRQKAYFLGRVQKSGALRIMKHSGRAFFNEYSYSARQLKYTSKNDIANYSPGTQLFQKPLIKKSSLPWRVCCSGLAGFEVSKSVPKLLIYHSTNVPELTLKRPLHSQHIYIYIYSYLYISTFTSISISLLREALSTSRLSSQNCRPS